MCRDNIEVATLTPRTSSNLHLLILQKMISQGCGKEVLSLGPWGGQGGLHWDDGIYSAVKQIEIAHGAGIDSIKIEYGKNGASFWSEKHGGERGSKTDRVRFDHDEYLISIHGHHGSVQARGPSFVRSLTLRSNKRTIGPYGVEQGTPFSLPMSHGKIVGFHGKAGWYLDAIGVYFETSQKFGPTNNATIHHSQRYISHGTEKHEYQMIQGNFGQDYELLVALKRKDDTSYFPPEIRSTPIAYPPKHNGGSVIFHPEIHTIADPYHEVTHSEHKIKVPSVAPAKIEKVPSKKLPQGVTTCGPWGGNGGTMFDDGVNDGIRQIHISRNVGIVSIKVCYERNGETVWGSKNGGTGGFKTDKVVFACPAEILTRITGYFGPTMGMGPTIIKSLTFHTTKGKYGPYGEEKGQQFSSNLQPGMIVGFHGRGGLFLDAIGVHLLEGEFFPAPSRFPSKPVNQNPVAAAQHGADTNSHKSSKLGKKWLTEDEAVQRIVKDPAPYGPGPWGGEGGKPWDDGVFTGIKQIILNDGEMAIFSIEIEYDRHGQSVWSVKHGSNGGKTTHRVKLDYPNEVLTCISGYYCPISKDHGTKVIKSLTFSTTRGKIGPFGEEIGSYFTSNTTEGKVVGFHGRSGSYLDAIGVHMQHWLGYQRATKPLSLKKMFS